jgi:hypothetical protein
MAARIDKIVILELAATDPPKERVEKKRSASPARSMANLNT